MEQWKAIEGYEGMYEISSEGRVRSVGRFQNCVYGGKEFRKEKIMKQSIRNGYCTISLCNGGKHKRYRVHRLVASAFIPNIYNKEEVNHINGIKTDNRTENLEWVTKSENALHAYRTLGIKPANERRVRCVETETVYKSAAEAARILGINPSQINNVIAGRYGAKTANGCHWKLEEKQT